MNIHNRTHIVFLVAVIFAACASLIPLFHSGFPVTHDGDWMIIRLSAFYQSLREGQFPVRFLGRLNNSYGYPVSNFLYPGYLYIGSMLHGIGFSFLDAVKIIMGGSVIISGIFVYLWLRVFVSPFSAFIGSVSYLVSPYLLFDLYERGSVGEVLAFSFAAIVLYAIERQRYMLIAPAVFFLVISHNSVALIFCCFFLLLLALRRNIKGILLFCLGIGMATFFWFPALYEKRYVIFDSKIISNPQSFFLDNRFSYLFPTIGLLSSLLIFFLKKSYISFYFFSNIFLLFLLTSFSQWVWSIESFARLFQFPFRMFSLSIFLSAYFIALVVDVLRDRFRMLYIVLVIISFYAHALSFFRLIEYMNHPEGFYATNESTTTVSGEYMPRWVRETPSERSYKRMIFQQGRGKIVFDVATTQTIKARVIAEEDSVLQINSIYYPGWGVLVNGLPQKISYDNPNGLIRFFVLKGEHEIFAEFRETIPRFVANSASLCFMLCYGGLLGYKFFIPKRYDR